MDDSQGGEPLGSRVHYTSCMKINGVPLLPPLMTEEYRHEMKYYRQLALAVERRISDLTVCLDDTTVCSNNLPSDTEDFLDTTNMSHDLSDKISQSDPLEPRVEQLEEPFQSNDFESMNSQVTIIDASSENKNDSQIRKNENEMINIKELSNVNKTWNVITDDDANKAIGSVQNTKLWTVGKTETDKPTVPKFHSSDPTIKKVDPNTKSPYLIRTHSKDNVLPVLGNNSSRNTPKNVLYNNPLKRKKSSPLKKENISPAPNKKITVKGKVGSPYETSKPRKIVHKLSPAKNITGSLNNISSGLISPPKLVRQNSYTLDSPSPLLLAHLECQSMTSGVDVGSISMSDSTSRLCQAPYVNLSASIGSDINSLSLGETSLQIDDTSKSSKLKNESNQGLSTSATKSVENELQNISGVERSESTPTAASRMSSTSKRNIRSQLFQETDIIKPNIPHNSASTNLPPESEVSVRGGSVGSDSVFPSAVQNEFENKIVSNGIEILSDLKSVSSKDSPKVYFDFIMRKFQEDHEKRMMALIQKQHEEQLILKKAFENQQKHLLDQFQNAFTNSSNQGSKKSQSSLVKTGSKSDKLSCDEDQIGGKGNKPKQPSLHKESSQHSIDTSCSENMEKYLTISADVLNTSRCLLINRKTVNLSPTDIQCVNVMPVQASMPCMDGELSRTERSVSRARDVVNKTNHKRDSIENGRSDHPVDSKMTMFSNRSLNDSYFDPNKSYDFDDIEDPLETGRTNNTLDDLNFTFSSDDGAHTNRLYTDGNRNEYFTTPNYNDDYDRASKLKIARSKISEIQKNLASQTLNMTRSLHLDNNYPDSSGNMYSMGEQAVSLSSIDVISNCYPRNFTDRNHLSLNLTEINKPGGRSQPVKRKCKTTQDIEREMKAASVIVAHCKGYLTRRLMRTERVESTVQTIRDTLVCALQLHRDEGGIQGPDVDLHRRLIQQITAACYALHDTFILSDTSERMAIIRHDRERRASRASPPAQRQLSATTQRFIKRRLESMSRSHSGVFSSRSSRSSHYPSYSMTRSHYEQSDAMRGDKSRRSLAVSGDINPRKPWR